MLTVLVGLTLHWTLPDSPETAKFLEPYERDFIIRRLQQDAGTKSGQVATSDGFKWASLRSALFEWKIWFAVLAYWGNSIPVYAFTYTAPTIIRDLGYSSANAQLLTVPVYLLGTISTVLFSIWADKRQTRWKFVCGPYGIAAIGFLALLCIPHPRLPGLTYAFLFFIPAGLYPALICLLSWIGNNLAPSWKRAVGMALLISVGNLGGAIGSNIFLSSQAPTYPLGYGLSVGHPPAHRNVHFANERTVLHQHHGHHRGDRAADRLRENQQEARSVDGRGSQAAVHRRAAARHGRQKSAVSLRGVRWKEVEGGETQAPLGSC